MNIGRWLLRATTRHLAPTVLIEELVAKLLQVEFPVRRMVFTLRAMHPEVWLESVRWERDRGAWLQRREHLFETVPLFHESPVKDIYAGEPGFRRNLLEPLSDSDFPILHELREKGDTDYLIASLELSPGVFSYISCSTDRPGGFSDADIALWDELQVPLAATVADLSTRMALQSLLTTYLGAKAADCVLSGQFKRGDGQSMEAVVWFSDLRGFTAFADRHTTTEVMDRLNRYFDVVGTALEAHGGEILKFIGDGVLAVLPLVEERPASEVVMAALEAARWTVDTLTRTGADDDTPFDVGIGLHAGRVTFGNVGTPRRLDFTTIGGPVNEAARIESLCKPLGHRVLVSKVVAELAQGVGLTSVGTHHLRGSRRPIELFRLDL